MRLFRRCMTAFLLLGFPASGVAADVVSGQAPLEAPAGVPLSIWSGPYAGAFVGYSFSDVDQSTGATYDGEGVVGGLYGGYNLQSGALVYGIEGDLGASNLDAGGFDAAAGTAVKADSHVFGSLRARVGMAYDPFLFFATGGVALADKELRTGDAADEKTHVGYSVGAGVESEVTTNLTSRVEYRYSDFERKTYDLGPATTSTGFDEHSIRAGLALKF